MPGVCFKVLLPSDQTFIVFSVPESPASFNEADVHPEDPEVQSCCKFLKVIFILW